MSDIVERLRNPDADYAQCDRWMREAADEIERLRAALSPNAREEELREAVRSLYKWAEQQKGFDATEWRDVRALLSTSSGE